MRLALVLATIVLAVTTRAEEFGDSFADSTLRIDYVLSGTPGNVGIGLKGLSTHPVWAGRRHNLGHPLYCGNGDVTVTSLSGDTLYTNSFSTLYNEWLELREEVPYAVDCPVLVPMPREKAKVTARLLDKRHQPIAKIEHIVDPSDILIRRKAGGDAQHSGVYLHKGDYDGPHIGVAILAEGYTAEQMDTFIRHAQSTADAILSYEPFRRYADRFDFIAVPMVSADSGVSVPKHGLWLDTAFGSHYSTFYSDRYLTSPQVGKMYDAIAGVPAQHIIVLANTEEYGGGGIFNSYTLTSARHSTFAPVVVHEFGHSFGGLADEYFYDGDTFDDTYPLDVEPWEPNITTLRQFGSKWEAALPEGTPIPTPAESAGEYPLGVYEGGGYSFHGVYRPAYDCRMRTNAAPAFCPACQMAIEKIIKFYTEPIR